MAMRTQQEAEKAEQQRIKSLVLNYDLRDEGEADGGECSHFHNTYITPNRSRRPFTEIAAQLGVPDKQHTQTPYVAPRVDKAGNQRSNQRARKLQLSDVDWYADKSSLPTTTPTEDRKVRVNRH